LDEISNDLGTRITESPARKWAIDAGLGGFDKEGKKSMTS
jgi:hypothetical protein